MSDTTRDIANDQSTNNNNNGGLNEEDEIFFFGTQKSEEDHINKAMDYVDRILDDLKPIEEDIL